MAHKLCAVLSDFDGTSFDTSKFGRALALAVSALDRTISPDSFHTELKSFYAYCGYDLRAHLYHHGLDFDEARPRLLRELSGTNFVFPDAIEAFGKLLGRKKTTDLSILTVGVPETQVFKIELQLMELRRRLDKTVDPIPADVIDIDKGTHLNIYWSEGICRGTDTYDLGILADDNAMQVEKLNIRPDMKVYNLCRHGAKYPPSPRTDVFRISDLRPIAA